jgi:vesicle transport protein SEC22
LLFISNFSCLIDHDVCYITLCDKTFPRKNAYAYLEELAQEFIAQYGQKIQLAARPYSFIEFGLFGFFYLFENEFNSVGFS